MIATVVIAPVRKSIRVKASQTHAFDVFTAGLERWWPRTHTIGKPPMKIKAGESYQIPEGAIHDAKAGDKPFKVLGVYVVKAGEPLAKPAP